MGYTSFTINLLEDVIEKYNPKNVLDLGSQQLYNQPLLPAPYVDTWYYKKGIFYECIDLNKENNAWDIDLSKEWAMEEDNPWLNRYSMVVDAGTSEHVSDNGKFGWEAIYNCWKIKHDLLRIGGVMVSENPMTGNWPGHGFNYYSVAFYLELLALAGYKNLRLGTHPAMGNDIDGWNVFCVMEKISEKYPTFKQFKKLPIYKK